MRNWHAKRAAHRSGLREGARLKFGPHTYVLGPKLPGRRGWSCRQMNDARGTGCEMRMPLSFLARAEILS